MTTEIAPYNPVWPQKFQELKKKIETAFEGSQQLVSINHVGSTSIPGLAAKPQIDIIVIVRDLLKAFNLMNTAGFRFSGEFNIPLHLTYKPTKPHNFDMKANIHIFDTDSNELEVVRKFRDLLIQEPALKEEYQNLKIQIGKDPESRMIGANSLPKYNFMKSAFIKSSIERSGFTGLTIKFANFDEDFDYIKEHLTLDKTQIAMVLFKGINLIGGAVIDTTSGTYETFIDPGYAAQTTQDYFTKQIEKWIRLRPYIYESKVT